MALKVRAPKDFWTGTIYVLIGLVGLVVGRDYTFGSAARMGPGWFPAIVSSLLIVVGIVAILRSLRTDGDEIGSLPYKAVVLVTVSVCAFALLVGPGGFVLALAATLFISAMASEHFSIGPWALLGMAVIVIGCALIFVEGLGVPMPLIGTWLRPFLPLFGSN